MERKAFWLKLAVRILGLLPVLGLIWAFWQNRLGPDPFGTAIRVTGRLALLFLILSLVPTALRILFGARIWQQVRRALGLYAFAYAALHLLAWAALGYGLDIGLMSQALRQSPFVLVGLAAFIVLLPLALTSTRYWMRRLGKNWQRLHRLAYVAAALAVLHYAWTFKVLRIWPVLVAAILGLLLLLRVPWVRRVFAE